MHNSWTEQSSTCVIKSGLVYLKVSIRKAGIFCSSFNYCFRLFLCEFLCKFTWKVIMLRTCCRQRGRLNATQMSTGMKPQLPGISVVTFCSLLIITVIRLNLTIQMLCEWIIVHQKLLLKLNRLVFNQRSRCFSFYWIRKIYNWSCLLVIYVDSCSVYLSKEKEK